MITEQEINYAAKMIAKNGAWSLFRLYFNGGTIINTLGRGSTVGDANRLHFAGVNATHNEANKGRWYAIAQFRKEMNG